MRGVKINAADHIILIMDLCSSGEFRGGKKSSDCGTQQFLVGSTQQRACVPPFWLIFQRQVEYDGIYMHSRNLCKRTCFRM